MTYDEEHGYDKIVSITLEIEAFREIVSRFVVVECPTDMSEKFRCSKCTHALPKLVRSLRSAGETTLAFQYLQIIQQVSNYNPGRQINARTSHYCTHQGMIWRSCFLRIRLSISLSSEVDMPDEYSCVFAGRCQ